MACTRAAARRRRREVREATDRLCEQRTEVGSGFRMPFSCCDPTQGPSVIVYILYAWSEDDVRCEVCESYAVVCRAARCPCGCRYKHVSAVSREIECLGIKLWSYTGRPAKLSASTTCGRATSGLAPVPAPEPLLRCPGVRRPRLAVCKLSCEVARQLKCAINSARASWLAKRSCDSDMPPYHAWTESSVRLRTSLAIRVLPTPAGEDSNMISSSADGVVVAGGAPSARIDALGGTYREPGDDQSTGHFSVRTRRGAITVAGEDMAGDVG